MHDVDERMLLNASRERSWLLLGLPVVNVVLRTLTTQAVSLK